MAQFRMVYVNDEQVNFFVNGTHVGSANHDEHGWAGMGAMENMFEAIATATAATFRMD